MNCDNTIDPSTLYYLILFTMTICLFELFFSVYYMTLPHIRHFQIQLVTLTLVARILLASILGSLPLLSFVCLYVLMLNIPVNNFSVMLGWSHRFLGITSNFQGVNVFLLKDTTWQR